MPHGPATHSGQTGRLHGRETPRGDEVRYAGFRAGDRATARGVVIEADGRRALRADLLFGGTPDDLLRSWDGWQVPLGFVLLPALAALLFTWALTRRVLVRLRKAAMRT